MQTLADTNLLKSVINVIYIYIYRPYMLFTFDSKDTSERTDKGGKINHWAWHHWELLIEAIFLTND